MNFKQTLLIWFGSWKMFSYEIAYQKENATVTEWAYVCECVWEKLDVNVSIYIR